MIDMYYYDGLLSELFAIITNTMNSKLTSRLSSQMINLELGNKSGSNSFALIYYYQIPIKKKI